MAELIGTTEGTRTLYTALADGCVMGYVAIDSSFHGRSCGGLRMAPRLDGGEMQALARAMTLKYGLLGLPQGGAKAGVLGDGDWPLQQRRNRLVEFGELIAPLLRNRQFTPCTDVGTSADDIRYMLRAVGLPVGRNELRRNSSGFYTAVSVAASATAAARYLGLDLAGRTAAIEGFGSVGCSLAGLLAEMGLRVVAVSTSRGAIHNPQGLDVGRLADLSRREGSGVVETYAPAERIAQSALLELPVDLLCPCALGGSIHQGNVARLAARIVAPGANNPMSEAAEAALLDRGVVCVPDFVANCGGVLGGTMEFAGVAGQRIVETIRRYMTAAVETLLARASREAVAPRRLAEQVAQRRREVLAAAGRQRGLDGMAAGFAAALHRRGLLPRRLVGAVAPIYFEQTLASMLDELR